MCFFNQKNPPQPRQDCCEHASHMPLLHYRQCSFCKEKHKHNFRSHQKSKLDCSNDCVTNNWYRKGNKKQKQNKKAKRKQTNINYHQDQKPPVSKAMLYEKHPPPPPPPPQKTLKSKYCTTWSEYSCRQTSVFSTEVWRQLYSDHVVQYLDLSHHLTKIFRKTTVPFLTFHLCPKSLKKSFSTNFSPISKKTTSAIPFSQPVEQDTALRPFCYVL